MIRKIKGLGLAFVAIAAMSMVVAGGAQATQLHVTQSPAESVIHGQQKTNNVFTTNAGTVTCTQATFEGTVAPATVQELTVTGTYTGCQAFGQAATIDTNLCKFTLTGNKTDGQTYGSKTVSVDVTGCTAGQSINITTGICRMTVPEQNHIDHIVFSNNTSGSPHDVTANITGAGIKYQADGPLCPTMPTGQTLTNGTYTGEGTFQAYKDIGDNPVTKHGHQYNEHLRGEALGLQVT